MHKTFRIASALYHLLYQKGGDKLIACYTELCVQRNGEVKYNAYQSKRGVVNGYNLLRNKTTLSLSVLKKYVPMLIELGLCYFNRNGDFVIVGSDRIKQRFKCCKIVPIIVGENYLATVTNCFAVRVHSSEMQQNTQIQKRVLQIRRKKAKNNATNYDVAVLSNVGFAELKDGANTVSKGRYWKEKLIKKGLILSKRQYKPIAEKKLKLSEYLLFKKYNPNFNKKLVLYYGIVSICLPNTINCIF